ncbi:MAG: hypothetical protein ABR501_14110, partial [Pyrinomonadaceae bacterium]
IAQYLERERRPVPQRNNAATGPAGYGAPDNGEPANIIAQSASENGSQVGTGESALADQREDWAPASLAGVDDTLATPPDTVSDNVVSPAQSPSDNSENAHENEHASAATMAGVSDQLISEEEYREGDPETTAEIPYAPAAQMVVTADEVGSQQGEVDKRARQIDAHTPAKPLVVRTLKDPPEIWDLVHEAPKEFKPSGAFLTRLTSSKTNLVLLTLAVLLIAGLGAFAFKTLREQRNNAGGTAQGDSGLSQTAPAPQTNAASSAPANVSNEPVNTRDSVPANGQLNTQSDTSPAVGYGIDNPANPTESQTTATQPGVQTEAANSGNALTDIVQPTGVSVGNASRRSSWRGRGQNGDKRLTRGSEIAPPSDPTAKPQAPQNAGLASGDDKSSQSASSKKKPDASSQSGPPPTSTPKAKVIQWP